MAKKRECRTLAVVNQKGGVGKTTTAVNLGAYLATAGKRVLLIDADPQSNATSGVGVAKTADLIGLYDVLVEGASIAPLVKHNVSDIKGFDLLPSTLDLSGAEMVLYTEQNFERESVLKKALKTSRSEYDYILIDAPPSLGLLTINIFTAADGLIIPIQCEYYALEGISLLLSVVDRIRESLNPNLSIDLVVMTMQDYRTNLSQQVISDVREYFGDVVASTPIPRNVRLSEAPSFGQPINLYDPKSKGAAAYEALAQEVINRNER
jgi:chromosome partitioning protein